MLRQQIYDEVKAAMKAREAERLETLRFIWSEIKNVEIDAKHELSDEEVIALLRREVKKRKEAIDHYRQADRKDLVEYEEKQLPIIEVYLPQMLSDEEIMKVIDEVAGNETDFGKVMGGVMGRLKGKADGAIVQRLVRGKLPV